jgi:hypothetical protein|tara:strand:- start:50 stop:226 length:177 start_codon:yes stop_codon:yes gene_type:complete
MAEFAKNEGRRMLSTDPSHEKTRQTAMQGSEVERERGFKSSERFNKNGGVPGKGSIQN